MPNYQPYLFSMRPEDRRQLDELAEARGVSRAAILRAGIALVAGHRPSNAPTISDQKPAGSPASGPSPRPAA
jgi:hypothetical protein